MKSVSGDSVTLNTDVTEVQRNDLILWMFNINNSDTRIAEIHRKNIYIDDSTVIFGDRLQMDSRTGSLTIRNIRTEHFGLYKSSKEESHTIHFMLLSMVSNINV